MDGYSFHGLVAREAVLREAAADLGPVRIDKLRFGLGFLSLDDELIAGMASQEDDGQPPFIEFVRLTGAVVAWALEASRQGPLAYVEGEHSEGAGFHAGVAWRDGRMTAGPRGGEDREPVNAILRQLGAMTSGAQDELDSVGILNR
jgi:hypothetical protein